MVTLPINGITDALVILDRDWRYVHVNAKAGELFGRDPASLVGRHIWTEFPDGVGQPFQRAYERVMASGVEEHFEAYYAPWDRWFENRVFPTAEGILILFTETTEARRAQQTLERSERRFRALAEATAFMAWWAAPDGSIAEPARQWLAFTGQTEEQARGLGWLAAVHPEDRARATGRWGATPPVAHVVEYRLRRRDGAWRTMVTRAVPVLGPDGTLVEWVGTLSDATEEREAQAALVASEARFRSLSASSPVGIFTADNAGSVTYVNPRAQEIWDATEPELLGFGWTARVHPDDLPQVTARWRAARAARVEHEQEYRLRLPGGAVRWVRGRSAPLRGPSGEEIGAVGTIVDVTERRQLERQLQQAQKMEAIGQLAGGIAHDFNNVLAVILANLELATGEDGSRPEASEHLREIVAAMSRAGTLTRQLLAFSRRQVLSVRLIDANALVRDAAALLRRVIGEEISLQVALAPGPVLVEVDPGQIEQVLLNLSINARDAMLTPLHGHPGRGGALTIETDALSLASPESAREWGAPGVGSYARIAVRDTGHGMDAETMSHVFEPFFTTKPVGEGTGLGLASAYGIVTQTGGSIRVESTPGVGTTFTVLLPRASAPPGGEGDAHHASASARPPAREATSPGGATVLLVEDERAVRAAAVRLLERAGYTVLEARHGADALVVWREHRDAIAAVLTDVRMPELGGRDLAARLHAEVPELPVVYLSGYPDQSGPSELRPFEAFVEKPFTAETLLEALRAALAGAGDASPASGRPRSGPRPR